MLKENIAVCKYGALRGLEQDGVRVFKGIPFALPPVGELRWRAPQKPAPWVGIRNAQQFMPAPIQMLSGPVETEKDACYSEDCLYLNIWTPAGSEDEKHAVFVWFYGGGYQGGRADDPTFDGTELAKKGIVVVTVNYRINVFGFMCHPDMKANAPEDHGNFGVMDQIVSLEWVNENIAAFGGDPSRINIGGQSAGSASVNCMITCPRSRGLIAGVLDESGDVFQPERDITFDQACRDGLTLQADLGCSSLDEMRALPFDAIIDAAKNRHMWCTPVIDGCVIPVAQSRTLFRKEAAQIPIIIGTNQDEGSGGGPGYRKTQLERFGIPEELYPDESMPTVMRLARDYWYSRHLAWIRIRANKQHLTTYHYNYGRSKDPIGAAHGSEIPYVFGTMEKGIFGTQVTYTEGDNKLRDIIMGYWVNFMKTGNPNGEGLPYWPPKSEDPVHMRLDLECRLEDDYFLPIHEIICPKVQAWMDARYEAENK